MRHLEKLKLEQKFYTEEEFEDENNGKIVFEADFPKEFPEHGYVDYQGNEFRSEDGGCAKIASIGNESGSLHVDIVSWDEDEVEHREMSNFLGRKVRITIEAI